MEHRLVTDTDTDRQTHRPTQGHSWYPLEHSVARVKTATVLHTHLVTIRYEMLFLRALESRHESA